MQRRGTSACQVDHPRLAHRSSAQLSSSLQHAGRAFGKARQHSHSIASVHCFAASSAACFPAKKASQQ